MAKGTLNFSMSTLVIIVISVAVIASGLFLINSLKLDLPKFESGMPQFFEANVIPAQAQDGSFLKIEVNFADKSLVFLAKALVHRHQSILQSIPLYDDGDHGDKKANDGIFAGIIDTKGFQNGKYNVDILINPSEKQIKYPNVTNFLIYHNNCIPLVYNGEPKNKVDVTILPYQYKDLKKFKKDAFAAIGFPSRKKGILTYEPFKSNANKFNFYIVNQSQELNCKIGCQGVDSLVCCDNNKVAQATSQCPSDKTLVLINSKKFCGSSSDYAKVCTGWNHGQVVTHEFGHLFGGLGDEYTYQEVYPGYKGTISVYPNCDLAGCSKWQNIWNGCFSGCGFSNRYRPALRKSIMYTYVDMFNVVSINHLIGLLNSYRIGKVKEVAAPPLENTYLINLNYKNGAFKSNNVFVTKGNAPDRKSERKINYFATIKGFNGKILDSFKFKFPLLEWPAMPRDNNSLRGHSPILVSDTNYTLAAPYFPNAKSLDIFNLNGKKVLNVDLGYLSKSCGDGICQSHESNLECPSDCSPSKKDDLCDYSKNNICDPDCVKVDPDCGLNKNSLYYILGAVLLGLLIAIYLFSREKTS